MKKTFFKAMVLPVLVAGVAVLSAFGTARTEVKVGTLAANENGWIRHSPQDCEQSTLCNVDGSVTCTENQVLGGTPLFKMAGNDCIVPLYKAIPQ